MWNLKSLGPQISLHSNEVHFDPSEPLGWDTGSHFRGENRTHRKHRWNKPYAIFLQPQATEKETEAEHSFQAMVLGRQTGKDEGH